LELSILFFYEGFNCPVCQKAFNEKDDIVVCPQCGLPHHRECWKQVGHCYLEHLHNTDEQWSREKATTQNVESEQPNVEERAYNICSVCGTQNPEYAEFCKHCGSPLEADTNWQQAPQPTYVEYQPFRSSPFTAEQEHQGEAIDGVTTEDLIAIVGSNTPYYLPRFRKISRNNGKVSWNWAAFFFGPFWLLYRKMYSLGVIVLVLQLLQSVVNTVALKAMNLSFTDNMTYNDMYAIVLTALEKPENRYFFAAMFFLSIIVFTVSIALCLFGNYLYLHHCKKTIKRMRATTPDLTAGELSLVGGTSFAVMIIGYIAQYFITSLISMFI
jgi:hypothetical protein